MNKVCLSILLALAIITPFTSLNAQKLKHVQGHILVMFEKGVEPEALIKQLDYFEGNKSQLTLVEELSIPLNIWKIRFDYTKINELRLLNFFEQQKEVIAAQFNHFTEYRRKPNDTDYDLQWHFFNTGQNGGTPGVDLDIEAVWDITTGGLTPNGDTVVVCVLDDGLDPSHQDFEDNIWVNYAEIAGNGIDDDNNGFVDDVRGWNAFFDNDEIDDDNTHGTPVAGVIGAKGNNGFGVTGVAWDVKLMIVSGGSSTEAENIQAFSYALSNRIKYNESGGREGAFVVAVNFSQGVPVPPDVNLTFPLWCALIDEMGQQGILTLAAAPNDAVNVDQVRDYPASCNSEYLMMINSVDDNGQFYESGFGQSTIDMAAFGLDIFTTTNGNNFDYEIGTSFATPLVSGAIALLYTAPCLSLSTIASSDPAGAALLARDLIYEGVVSDPTLTGRTLTGGYLNIKNSIDAYLNGCVDCNPPTSFAAIGTTDRQTTLEWSINDSITQVDLRIRRVGNEDWVALLNVSSPLEFDDLIPCSTYEVQFNTQCDDETLGYGNSNFFQTDGCCEAPNDLSQLLGGDNQALIGWSSILAAASYNVRYRIQGDEDWIEVVTPEASILLTELQTCSPYEIQVQTNCDTLLTPFSASFLFETLGCGSCTDLEYCVVRNADNAGEWIETVAVGDFINQSGKGDESFSQFTDLEGPTLALDSTYSIALTPGFDGRAFSEYFRVWIDYNQDGFFTSGEIVFDSDGAVREQITGNITIPSDAVLGRTRMRVVMNFNTAGGPCTLSGNGNSIPGEVEDYCVNIVVSTIPCCAPDQINMIDNSNDFISLAWTGEACGASAHIVRYRALGTTEWTNDFAENSTLTLSGLEECNSYEVQVQGLCGSEFSDFTNSFTFSTACTTSSNEAIKGELELTYSPNPASEQLNISFQLSQSQTLELELINLTGQLLRRSSNFGAAGRNNIQINVGDLASGVYFVSLKFEKGKVVEKIIVE